MSSYAECQTVFAGLPKELLAQYRGQGLVAPLLRALMDEATQAGKSVGIQLDSYDQSQPLFERLGFKPTVADSFHTSFVWQPHPT